MKLASDFETDKFLDSLALRFINFIAKCPGLPFIPGFPFVPGFPERNNLKMKHDLLKRILYS